MYVSPDGRVVGAFVHNAACASSRHHKGLLHTARKRWHF